MLKHLSFETAGSAVALSVMLTQLMEIGATAATGASNSPAINVSLPSYGLLFLATLAFYNVDHAIDTWKSLYQQENGKENGKKLGESQSSKPRIGPWGFRVYLLTIAGCVIMAVLLAILSLAIAPSLTANLEVRVMLSLGILLACICCVYFSLLTQYEHRLHLLKEITVALLFTCGVCLPGLARILTEAGASTTAAPLTEILAHKGFLLAFMSAFLLLTHNALIASYLNYEQDVREGNASLIRSIGLSRSLSIIYALGFLSLLIMLIFLPRPAITGEILSLYFIAALIVQSILLRLAQRSSQQEALRFILDGYFIPLSIGFILVDYFL